MMPNKFYIFRSDLSSYSYWKQRFNGLRAIWYDGTSSLVDDFADILLPEILIVEEGLAEIIAMKTGFKGEILSRPGETVSGKVTDGLHGKSLALFASNDTHVLMMRNVISRVRESADLTIYVPALKQENAMNALDKFNLDYISLSTPENVSRNHDGLILANDWGLEERYLAYQFQKRGKPVVCLQESVVQFGDQQHRLEWCDYPFIQGIYTLKNLRRELVFLTGNPRYEMLAPTILPDVQNVLINCNFTYGIYETFRSQWLDDIVSVLGESHVNYSIAQHPRDTGNLKHLHTVASSPAIVHQLLQNSTLLITRFSSLIHESLALGRPVIYYNPHGEEMYYDFTADGTNLILAKSKKDLRSALKTLLDPGRTAPLEDPFYRKYGMAHHGSSDGHATDRVVQALKIALATRYRPTRFANSRLKLEFRYQRAKWKHEFNL